MANFNISNCQYINRAMETNNPYIARTKDPYKYYLETLKLAVYSLAEGDEEIAEPFYERRGRKTNGEGIVIFDNLLPCV